MPGFRWDKRRSLLALILAGLNTVLGGCVAMNIPSVRYADSSDRGGLLGPQRPAGSTTYASGGCDSSSCGAFTGDGDSVNGHEVEEPPVPQIPWPRFHPLPTRPVFAPSLNDSF